METLKQAKKQDSGKAWLVCSTAAAFFFLESIRANMFNSLAPSIMATYSIDAFHFAQLSSIYLLANVLFIFPAGMLLDRFSIKWLLLGAVCFCILGGVLFYMSSYFMVAEISLFVTGMGCAFSFLGAIKLASRWFSPNKLAIVIGLIVLSGMLGGLVAQLPIVWFVQHFYWKDVIACLAISETVLLIFIYFFIADIDVVKELTAGSCRSVCFSRIKQVLLNTQNWLGGLYTSLLNLPVTLLGAAWTSLYLMQVRHFRYNNAALVSSLLFIGMIIGSPFMGYLSDKLHVRRLPMFFGAVFSFIIMLCIIYVKDSSAIYLGLLFFLLGFASSVQTIGYTIVVESNDTELAGISTALASVLVMGGGTIFHPVFGWVMNFHWRRIFVHNVPLYTATSYNRALFILPIAFIVAIIIIFGLRETHPKVS